MRNPRLGSMLLVVGSLLCLWAANAAAITLTIGRVSDNPSRHYRELKPLLDYVVSHLKDLGVTEGSVLLAKDKNEMIKLLRERKVDWATKGVFQAILYSEEVSAELFLRSWRGGAPVYYGIMFTRKDSSINALNDLKGKKIAFEDAGSTSAYFVPAAILKRAGFELLELPSPREKPPADKVGYAFAGGELNITTWVHKGLTHAGAYHNQDWEDPEVTPESMKKDLKIFYRGKPLPRMVEVVRKDLDPRIKNRLKEILLKAHEDPSAQEALKKYSKTTKFDEFKGEAREGLDEARQMLKYIPKEFE